MKACLGSRRTAPRILGLGRVTPGNESLVLNEQEAQEAECAQRRSGRGEEKNSQTLPGLEPPIIQPVAQR
jgi:hypothetical protein